MDLLKILADGRGDNDGGDGVDGGPRSPDELLLELIDLVALAFPSPLARFEVRVVPNEDGVSPALENLSGVARPDTAARPDLGHSDDAVLDAINALVGELGEATLAGGGVKVLRGRIVVEDVADGGKLAQLFDDSDPTLDPLVMSRRFDASELRWLFFTPELCAALARTADTENRQERQVREALLGMKRFDIDMKKARITFSGDPRPAQPWGFELIGSFLDDDKRFLWGWANEAVDEGVVVALNAFRRSCTGPGLRVFTDADFAGPERMFDRLARHVAVAIGAFGVYRAPFTATHGKGVMFLALKAL
jgi:hypothetical protein